MNVFCLPCKENHHFTPLQIEALLYALQADVCSDPARVEIREGKIVEYRADPDDPDCFESLLKDALDSEGYAEHVEAMIDVRKRRDKER